MSVGMGERKERRPEPHMGIIRNMAVRGHSAIQLCVIGVQGGCGREKVQE